MPTSPSDGLALPAIGESGGIVMGRGRGSQLLLVAIGPLGSVRIIHLVLGCRYQWEGDHLDDRYRIERQKPKVLRWDQERLDDYSRR